MATRKPSPPKPSPSKPPPPKPPPSKPPPPKPPPPKPPPPKPPPPKSPPPKPPPPKSPEHTTVVYKVRDDTTTMRSGVTAKGSWFIGTLSKGDRFYHYWSDPTRIGKWIWGHTPHGYGCLDGRGWVSVDDLELVNEKLPDLDNSVRQKLREPHNWTGDEFTNRFAHESHLPTDKSKGAEWKVTIKQGAIVPFYINQRDGQPVAGQLHRTHPKLTSADDGSKLKVRYLLKKNPNLMVADIVGAGSWGFILKQGDNFTVDFN
jgi:hypothetical protein